MHTLKHLLAVTPLLVLAQCGGGPKNLCVDRNVQCEAPLSCDPTDGVCKCGGRGGVVCPTGSTCDPLANTCVSSRCDSVICSSGTSCDVLDGKCKCGGTGGTVCENDQVCQPATKKCVAAIDCNQVACPANQVCETSSGRCLCGTTQCGAGQFCSPTADGGKTCVDDLCSGVTCAGENVCDPADGYCKCNGATCQSGEACACPAGTDGGTCDANARSCRPSSSCVGVTCGGGTTCDPIDGVCKCGGPGGPVCSSVQICSLGPPAQCEGGQQCLAPDGGAKSCPGGTSCDPEDGACKCGGRGGTVCKEATATDPGEVCVSSPFQQACRRPCNPNSSDCPTGTYCFYDTTAATPVAYCSAPTDSRGIDQACTSATACFQANPGRALHCTGLAAGSSGICRYYCDVSAGNAGCPQSPKAHTCVQISGAPANYGFCQPQ